MNLTTVTVDQKDELFFKSRYTYGQTQKIVQKYQESRDKLASNQLFEIFKKQCRRIAHNYEPSGLPWDDRMQSACEGLYEGVLKYNLNKGVGALSSFLWRTMNTAIKNQIRGYSIKVGTTASKNIWLIKKEMEDNNLSFEEVCKKHGFTKKKIKALSDAMHAVGLCGISTELEKTLAKSANPVLEEILDHERMEVIERKMLKLPVKYRRVVELKLEGLAVKQIAAILECSEPSVSTWFNKACKLLSY